MQTVCKVCCWYKTKKQLVAKKLLYIWAQIHRYCLKIYLKMCHKIILRQKL